MRKSLIPVNRVVIATLVIIAIYLTSLYSYLLFHSITEIFTVLIVGSIFVLAWNTRQWMENGYFLFIGISFLFVGALDFLHALSYKGMNVFPEYDANLPTQLWILARYIQSISLLIAPLWLKKRLSPWPVIAIYIVAISIALSLIFTNNFPASYVEGAGLTNFKIISEYVIIIILMGSSIPLFINSDNFEHEVWLSLILFILLTVTAEFAFTTYLGVYDQANLIGHLLRIVSHLFLYQALLKTGLQTPYNLIFRDIKQKETALQQSETNLKRLFDISPFPVVITRKSDAHLIKVNQAAMELFELTPDDLDKYTGLDFYVDRAERHRLLSMLSQHRKIQEETLKLKTVHGKILWCLIDATLIDYEGEECLLIGMADITEQKRIQEELKFLSMHDTLTGVYNRTYFETEMERLRKGRRHPVSIIMLDTDDLKVVNDTYGHAQGDKMLQTVAVAVKEILRSEEVFARIGGDEFAILLPDTDKETSRLVVARIKDQLKKYAGENGNIPIKVSIGLGVADVGDDINEAFKQADTNMYSDKYFKKKDTKPLRPLGEEWKKYGQSDHGSDEQKYCQ